MRVAYRTYGSWREVAYDPNDVCFCCEDMRREWGVLIGFGVKGHLTSNRAVNIFSLHQYSTGTIIPAITEIGFCPWCGEKIEVVRAE